LSEDATDYLPLALAGDSPEGGDRGFFLVSTVPSGAEISLVDISGTTYPQGNTGLRPLNVTLYLTATPMRSIVASLAGYRDAVYTIDEYPARGETVPITLTLDRIGPEPYRPVSVPGRVQAEDYNLGGEGAAYHDTTPGNAGGAYRADDVDIESANGITNVGWIRNGEYLTYTVNVTTTGDYAVAARVATPNTGCRLRFFVDEEPGTVLSLPRTGSFTTYATVTRTYQTGSPQYPLTPVSTPMPETTGFPPS
jgi:hypothetical protein